jgi:hypothetical protein
LKLQVKIRGWSSAEGEQKSLNARGEKRNFELPIFGVLLHARGDSIVADRV